MAKYLRDQQLQGITLDVGAIEEVAKELYRRGKMAPEHNNNGANDGNNVFVLFTIRFDQKGYKVFDVEELLKYFNTATDVERIIFQIESGKSIQSNKAFGSYLELKLDKLQPSILIVSSDDEIWMKDSFLGVKEIVERYRNKNKFFNNSWSEIFIQVLGVFIGFGLGVWGATKIASYITIENGFLISFLILFLIFSNLWAKIGAHLKLLLNHIFPSIKFFRKNKDKSHWLYRTIVGGITIAVTFFFLSEIFKFVGRTLGAFVITNP